MVDYFDDGVGYANCPAGHRMTLVVQSPKFEILLDRVDKPDPDADAAEQDKAENFAEDAMVNTVLSVVPGLSPRRPSPRKRAEG